MTKFRRTAEKLAEGLKEEAEKAEKEVRIDFLKMLYSATDYYMGEMPPDDDHEEQYAWLETLGWIRWNVLSLLNKEALKLSLSNVPISDNSRSTIFALLKDMMTKREYTKFRQEHED